MFIVNLKYTLGLDLSSIEKFITEHRKFLDKYYDKGYFILSGPIHPRIGGIILANIEKLSQLKDILKEDPFYINDVAEYEITEFTPTKWHKNLNIFLKKYE
ncbi:YciI family protein [Rickettsia hoogstraalii]|uniref:YciI family protein n=1 Tax=Rickettsia hoogstraalii TaxID=467174 RepID=UPI00058CF6FF|nr:YciI family protein [Rickettsia hoogstraalii]MCX4083604.1 YciI family protein [Rickettsia hoogstraalii]